VVDDPVELLRTRQAKREEAGRRSVRATTSLKI
jgi:hypothetical protein